MLQLVEPLWLLLHPAIDVQPGDTGMLQLLVELSSIQLLHHRCSSSRQIDIDLG